MYSSFEGASFDEPYQQQQQPTPQTPQFYSVNSYDDPRQQPSGSEMTGHMQGQMAPPNAMPPQTADGSFIPRNISASLLGEGDGSEPPILEGAPKPAVGKQPALLPPTLDLRMHTPRWSRTGRCAQSLGSISITLSPRQRRSCYRSVQSSTRCSAMQV